MAPKRILHVVSAMNRGGTETLLMNVYRYLDKSKIQFDFVSHRQDQSHYDEEIESLGGKIYRIKSLGQSRPVRYIQSLKKVMTEEHYFAVHSHTDFQSGFPALAAKLVGIKKIVCHAHTNQMQRDGKMTNKLIFPVLRALIKYNATDYCACSSEAAQFLFGKKAMNEVRILKNGIDVDEYLQLDGKGDLNIRQELQLTNDVKILGHVGSLSHIKNHGFILKVLKSLRDEGLDMVAIFAGDGPLRKELEEQSKSLGIHQYVYFLGVRSDIPMLMRAFDVFIFPSLYEGFGIVTLEAQCAGTPCVVSDQVPTSTDMGLGLVQYVSLEDNPDAWANEIKIALLKESPDQQLVKNHFLGSGFHIRDSLPRWLALYGITG